MKKAIQPLAAITFTTLLMMAGSLFASGDHDKDHDNMESSQHKMSGMKHDKNGAAMGEMFLVKQQIDGYDVTFNIMKAKPGKEMGGSHDLMIKVEKDGKALTDVVINTKVVHPNEKSETKSTMQMGEWLMAGYDLGHEGKHQIMILFKTADGQKHKGGVYYPEQ